VYVKSAATEVVVAVVPGESPKSASACAFTSAECMAQAAIVNSKARRIFISRLAL
jgi:hypothetical protein